MRADSDPHPRHRFPVPSWAAGPRQWVEWFAILNLGFMGVDVYLAHSVNAFAHWAEWVPFWFSVVSPVVLLVGVGLGGLHQRGGPGAWPGMVVGWAAVVVGVVGLVLHLESQFFEQQTLKSLVYTAPFAAPLAYAGVGLLLIMNRMVDEGSGEWAWWVTLLALGGFVGNFVLSLADHAANGFYVWTEWIPVAAAALGIGFLVMVVTGVTDRGFLLVCFWVMLGEAGVGVLGAYFHVVADLEGRTSGVMQSVVYGAPPFAPLLFADLAQLAAIGLWAFYRGAKAGGSTVAAPVPAAG